MMPRVSVIIPTFNRHRKVVRAVSSVLQQTFLDHEIIVVDDGSTDDTNAVLTQFGARIFRERHPKNRGVSAARNTGIRKSSAPLIAFLDSDDYWLPDKLAEQVAFFDHHADSLAVQTEEIWVRNSRRVSPKKRHQKPSGDIFEPSLKLCLVSPSAVMLKRSLLDEVGLFDESFPACEDYDLWLRISCRHPVSLIDKKLVVKEGGHPDQLSQSIMGMDRFRVRALVKLIKSGMLNKTQRDAAMQELTFKCTVYGHGCLKRGKTAEGNRYLRLPQDIETKLSFDDLTGRPCERLNAARCEIA